MNDADHIPEVPGGSRATEQTPRGITPEIVAVIESAASSLLGRNVRIVSIALSAEAAVRPGMWESQGRDIIQGAHNLVQRGH